MQLEDDELLKDFVIESQEHLSQVESNLLELESDQVVADVAKVNTVFRAIHSIKGVAGFLNLKTVETLAHREEEVLNRLRNRELVPTRDVIKTLLLASDCLKGLLDCVMTSNDQDVSHHIRDLEQWLIDPPKKTTTTTDADQICEGIAPEVLRDFLIESHDNLEQLDAALVQLEQNPADESLLHAIFRTIHTIKGSSGFLALRATESVAHAAENLLSDIRSGTLLMTAERNSAIFAAIDVIKQQLIHLERDAHEGPSDADAVIARLQSVHMSATKKAPEPIAGTPVQPVVTPQRAIGNPPCGEPIAAPSASESTIRVDVALLDKLMTRVGELVLARNRILQSSGRLRDNDLHKASQHLNLITSELQEGVMKTRMQPIGNLWGKFPRLVRDLAEMCGKNVRIETEGKETELDKTIIEAIKDPLTHLVRNTVDHGIEKPEVRIANGKPAEGCLFLRSYHEGGQVNIEISDDGAGLNLDRIRSIAVKKNLITADQAARLDDREAAQLIFLPGFSTAETVSNVSGRGVGMDVVKTNIEKIGGTVDLKTVAGQGTTIKMKIPLTLAIIPALIITNNGNRFAIPQVNLLELVRLDANDKKGIEWVQGAPVYRLRGRLLPLVYLRNVFDSPPSTSDVINIVVLRVDDRQFGLVVDRINDTEEIVVKPMSQALKSVAVFSGATIMGDGKVALILDVLGLAHTAQIISSDRNRPVADIGERYADDAEPKSTLLILGTKSNRRLALPISQVARLEKIAADKVEWTDNFEVVQYRGRILPLIRLADVLEIDDPQSGVETSLNVVVYTENDDSYGLVVNRIIDITETTLDIVPGKRDGFLGSAIIQGHVTILVDLPAIIRRMIGSNIQPQPTSEPSCP